MRWKKIAARCYKTSAEGFDAYVFGASSPMQFWGWAVWGPKAKDAGVETGFSIAKREAEAAITALWAKRQAS